MTEQLPTHNKSGQPLGKCEQCHIRPATRRTFFPDEHSKDLCSECFWTIPQEDKEAVAWSDLYDR
jgi:hypothetical protein